MRDLSGRNIRKFLKLISKKAFLGPKKSQNNKVAEKRRVNHNRESKKKKLCWTEKKCKETRKRFELTKDKHTFGTLSFISLVL